LVVSTSAIDCLERLVSDMTYVSSGTLNPAHSFICLICDIHVFWFIDCLTCMKIVVS